MLVTWELLFAYDMVLFALAGLVLNVIASVIGIATLVITIVLNIKK